jgi:hypothetical protein
MPVEGAASGETRKYSYGLSNERLALAGFAGEEIPVSACERQDTKGSTRRLLKA